MQMMYPPADDVPDDICHPHVDDVHVTPGVVLHEIMQVRQEEGSRHLEQLCIKPTGLLVKCFDKLYPTYGEKCHS